MEEVNLTTPSEKLSLRAIGLLTVFEKAGRVIRTEELRGQYREGRDSILTAKRELRKAGYIEVERQQVNGRWNTYVHLSSTKNTSIWSEIGKSGDLTV
jgi:hypothetical protein